MPAPAGEDVPRTPRRPPLSGLERTLKGAKSTYSLGRAVLPVLQREDFDRHIEYIVKDDPIVAAYLQRDPKYRTLLSDTMREVYDKKYRPYLTGAKLIDSWDRVTSALGGLADIIPGIGTAVSGAEEIIELAPKIIYSAIYATGTQDYKFLPKAAAYEAASFAPVVGDLVDMSNLYVDRARETFRKKVADEFLKKLGAKGTVQ